MSNELNDYNLANKREYFVKKLIKRLIGVKYKLGLGLDVKSDMQKLTAELHKSIHHNIKTRKVIVLIDEIWGVI